MEKRLRELAFLNKGVRIVLVDERGIGEGRDQFVSASNRNPSRYGLEVPTSRRSVEGYLMPDSYLFPRGTTNREVIVKMLRNWNTKILRPHQALFRQADLPLDKIIILASLIEREARVDEDRALMGMLPCPVMKMTGML